MYLGEKQKSATEGYAKRTKTVNSGEKQTTSVTEGNAKSSTVVMNVIDDIQNDEVSPVSSLLVENEAHHQEECADCIKEKIRKFSI